ncbi:MAG: hypothetical protein AAGF25_05995, partial [Pseudomonadota bacterium]
SGGEGDDRMSGAAGNDIMNGGAGDDRMSGGEGDDMFIYQSGDGNDVVYGGGGDSWVDTLELKGFDSGSMESDWTIQLDNGAIESQEGDQLVLSDDASGSITFNDGSSIDFFEIEQIQW